MDVRPMQKLIPLLVLTLALAVIIGCCVILAVIMGHGLSICCGPLLWCLGQPGWRCSNLGQDHPITPHGSRSCSGLSSGPAERRLRRTVDSWSAGSGQPCSASGSIAGHGSHALYFTCWSINGRILALPVVWLRQRRSVNEVVSSLLMNYVAIYVADYLVRGPLGDGTALARTPVIPVDAQWQPLWQKAAVDLTLAPLVALLLSLAAQMWLVRTVWGYEVTATGSNALAAELAGIRVSSWQRRIFVASGMLAGLAGALEVVAVHHRFYASFSPGYGFDGITIAFWSTRPRMVMVEQSDYGHPAASEKWLQLLVGISRM